MPLDFERVLRFCEKGVIFEEAQLFDCHPFKKADSEISNIRYEYAFLRWEFVVTF